MTLIHMDAKSAPHNAASPATVRIATDFAGGMFAEVFEENTFSTSACIFTKND